MFQEAIQGYTNYMQISKASSTHIKEHITRLTLKQQLIIQNPFFYNNQLSQALELFKRQNYPQALMIINAYIARNTHHNQAKLFKIQTLSAMGNIKQALNQTFDWIKQDPEQEIWFELIHLLAVHHKHQTAVARM